MNPEHCQLIRGGVDAIRAWRAANPNVRLDLSGADLRDANLRRADLHDANLRGVDLYLADLRDANLGGADLSLADLRSANLRRADLRDANLRGADLYRADLSGADLRGADLHLADLRDAELNSTDLSGAKSILAIGPGGSREDMLYAVAWPDGYRIKAGCWWGTLAEFRLRVAMAHGDSRHGLYYQAVCEFLVATEKAAVERAVERAVSPSDIQDTPPAS